MADLPEFSLHVDRVLSKVQHLMADLEATQAMVGALSCQVEALEQEESPLITPSAAVYAFMGFLMSQDPPVSFGRMTPVGPGMTLAGKFCQIQGWAPPPEGFSELIKPWNGAEA